MSIVNTNGTKSLGRKELVAMAVGNIIGGGVMTMTGIAMKLQDVPFYLPHIIQCGPCAFIMSLPLTFF